MTPEESRHPPLIPRRNVVIGKRSTNSRPCPKPILHPHSCPAQRVFLCPLFVPSVYQPRRPRASPLWQLVHHGWDEFLANTPPPKPSATPSASDSSCPTGNSVPSPPSTLSDRKSLGTKQPKPSSTAPSATTPPSATSRSSRLPTSLLPRCSTYRPFASV